MRKGFRLAIFLCPLVIGLTAVHSSRAGDEGKLSEPELIKRYQAKTNGTLTDAEFSQLIKGKVNWSEIKKYLESRLTTTNKVLEATDINDIDRILRKGYTFALFEIMVGAKLQNPYTIDVTTPPPGGPAGTGTFKGNNTTTDGFIEADMIGRYIFRTGIYDYKPCDEGDSGGGSFRFQKLNMAPDFDFKFGYVFRGKEAPTNNTVSSISGSSDFYTEGSIGVPLVRYFTHDRTFKFQTTLEASAGFTTDKSFDHLHTLAFGGIGFQMANVRAADVASQGDIYLLPRFGFARYDRPKLIGTAVELNGFGSPRFQQTWAPSAGVTALYRISEGFLLQLSGNAFFKDSGKERPSWNLSAALSVDPSKFLPNGK